MQSAINQWHLFLLFMCMYLWDLLTVSFFLLLVLFINDQEFPFGNCVLWCYLIISCCNPTWLRHLTNPDLTDGWMRFPVGMVWAIPSGKDILRLSVPLASFVCFPWLWHSARRKLPRCSYNQVRIATVSVIPPSWCRSKPLVCLDYSQVTDPGDYRLVK